MIHFLIHFEQFLGYVGFVVGGGTYDVELYSPEGKCQYKLAPFPADISDYIPCLMFFKNQVIVCGRNPTQSCFVYDIIEGSWSATPSMAIQEVHFKINCT